MKVPNFRLGTGITLTSQVKKFLKYGFSFRTNETKNSKPCNGSLHVETSQADISGRLIKKKNHSGSILSAENLGQKVRFDENIVHRLDLKQILT